jgi:FkbM family methyltransferase
MMAFANDTVITRSLQTYGEWSEHEIDGLSRYIRDDTLVLDIGANIGTHSLAFAQRKPKAVVWGFEPQPLVSSLAWTNCARNDARNVTILQMACGDKSDEVILGPPLATEENVGALTLVQSPATFVGPDATGTHKTKSRASIPFNGLWRAWKRLLGDRKVPAPDPMPPLVRVPIAPLDSLRFPFPVSLVKIDVEGMEAAVLSGARQLLARDRPAVFFETLSTESLAAPFAMLRELNYHLFWMETHQFNRANFRQNKSNLWWRTEMGVLALPLGVEAPSNYSEVERVPVSLPYREDARAGVICSV